MLRQGLINLPADAALDAFFKRMALMRAASGSALGKAIIVFFLRNFSLTRPGTDIDYGIHTIIIADR